MSVTFSPEIGPVDHFVVECLYCGTTTSQQFDLPDAESFVLSVQAGATAVADCERTEHCPRAATVVPREAVGELPEVNVSVYNAMTLLDALGVDYRYEPTEDEREHDCLGLAGVELVGGLDAQDFMGRVLTALAVAPQSAEVPAHAAVGAPNVVNCGRREGYLQEKLVALHEVAQFAADHGRDVQWV